MITLNSNECEYEVTQNDYDKVIMSLELNQIPCSHCEKHALIVHGYYYRNIINSKGTIKLRILRVKCKECGKTHAVFISQIVPFSSIQLNDQVQIIRARKFEELNDLFNLKEAIDELKFMRVKRNYKKYFEERLLSLNIEIDNDVVVNCFQHFKCNFMQIRWGINSLILETT